MNKDKYIDNFPMIDKEGNYSKEWLEEYKIRRQKGLSITDMFVEERR